LLLDQERVLGADHPDILTNRDNLAHLLDGTEEPI
jgi:hypothetical protein